MGEESWRVFSVIVSLAISVVETVVFFSSIPWAAIKSSAFLWLVRIEMSVSLVLSICTMGLLGLFFLRSRRLLRWLPSYFKIRGIVGIIDFIGLMLLDDIMAAGLFARMNIEPVIMGAFWCFLWAWYFKRAFRI